MAQSFRPTSPHLEIYKSQITMVMSIMHRITGVGLYFGVALLTWWLAAAAIGGDALDLINGILGSWFGQLILIGFTWAMFHHLLGGLRHMVWFFGKGLDEQTRFAFAWGTLIGGLVLTLFVWVFFVWM